MDENKLKQIIQHALEISYSGMTIVDFKILPTSQWDENVGEWIPHSYSLFLGVKQPLRLEYQRNIEYFLESLIGFECCVDFV